MLEPSHYEGKEQTFVKHFVLENYLERVAYNIASFKEDFVYVDGFSGPWKSGNEAYEDTSFKIAIDKLRAVRQGLQEGLGKSFNFRCMFIEKHRVPFAELKPVIERIDDIEIKLIHGAFEDHTAGILDFVQGSFSLIFIDPTGWQGFAMAKISPLFSLRGEILINFMSDFINRFIDDPRPEIAASFDSLFGDNWYPDWKDLAMQGLSREAAAIKVYTNRLKKVGKFEYVTFTRILKPRADRSYFYLIHATRHWKGVQVFRSVEKRAVEEQESVRDAAKYRAEVDRTGQENLFGQQLAQVSSFQEEKAIQARRGHETLMEVLIANSDGIEFGPLLGEVLQTPLVWESELKGWITELRKQGKITIPQLRSRERVPKPDYLIIPTDKL